MRLGRATTASGRRWIAAIFALALCLKALVPAGYMVEADQKVLTVTICTGMAGGPHTAALAIPMKDDGKPDHRDSAKDTTCAFTGLAKVAPGAADEVLLGGALVFILLLGLTPIRSAPLARILHLRPPLRGPPAVA
ncbi:DUF2946 family protein [Pelagerythrobacter sp.]|uniref:DUF2946 family protein n=1 Tax=Pelagerythrobacter sp. TaxID=2800702 RepID=UPI0035B4F717